MIKISNVSYKISNEFELKELNLTINPGVHHLLGPNGAGKTSLLNLISGLCAVDKGSILIKDLEVDPLNLRALSKVRAYLLQKQTAHFALTVKAMLTITLSLTDKEIDKLCENNIIIKGLDLKPLLNRVITGLSGGETQRAHLARVLLHCAQEINPASCLLLDEPFTGLDVAHKLWLNQYLSLLGECITIIISHHELNLALNLAQPCIIINKGRIHSILSDSRDIERTTLLDVFNLPVAALIETNEGILQIIGI
ncbi:hypothetical protein CJF42_13370 [Pseudoalteromonas sp. NBT06-2]|uniref:ABC transporter ATP-binding protein n=1 Tax=Pseudoalteromonas sp. NBT06-2 TaxID=2025950 RepID=UPI000BA6155E|nr:ABC transporter ATP-binding protein [Pseudoalteromonas sp. NBT06-2]PAJ73889.1 hypothetical protein CJF42_13370 [Pseudoalteromonas sp. NBT06-2]